MEQCARYILYQALVSLSVKCDNTLLTYIYGNLNEESWVSLKLSFDNDGTSFLETLSKICLTSHQSGLGYVSISGPTCVA